MNTHSSVLTRILRGIDVPMKLIIGRHIAITVSTKKSTAIVSTSMFFMYPRDACMCL